MGDDELLQAYTGPGSDTEWAFRQLVDRYAGLVFSIALRRVGDRELAEEISQTVFTVLARKASQLNVKTSLAGWLHRATMLESAKVLRTEYRRKRKMDELTEHMATEQEGRPDWDHVMPLVDEALHKLSASERDLILQHYLEERSYEEIAIDTGRTKAACAKQSSRVLAKLCHLLRRQGVTISAVALGAGITAHYATSVPVSLTHTLYQTALSAAASSTTQSTIVSTLTAIMTTSKFTTAAALIALGASMPLSYQWATLDREGTSIRATSTEHDSKRAALVSTSLPSNATDSVGGDLVGIDLELLERELKKLPFPDDEIHRQLDLERLMFQLREDEVPAVVAMIERLDSDPLGPITEALFARWAEFEPKAAAAKAEDLEHKYYARQGVMVTWAAADPVGALEYLEAHPNGKKQSSMVWATIGDMADSAPEQALALIQETLSDQDVSTNVTKFVLQGWAESDPEAALKWVAAIEDETLNRSYSKAVVNRLASHDPSKAFRLSMETLHPANRVDSARWTLMQWTGQDVGAASEAYVSMPEEFFKDEQMTRSAVHFGGQMAQRDPDRAVALADQIPDDQSRKQWLYGAAWEMASSNPSRAAGVAESLPPSGGRTHALKHIGKTWLAADTEAAIQWITNSTSLDAEAKHDLLNLK